MDINNIPINIRKIRDFKNITRDSMASEMNMSVSGYSKIERGEIDITVFRLQKIAGILNVSITDILNLDVVDVFDNSTNHCIRNQPSNCENANSNTQKYILMLESEIERLKVLLSGTLRGSF